MVVFIVETWLEEARLPGVLKKLNFKSSHCVSRENRGGGLVLLWNSELDVCVEMSTLYHIDAIINKGKADAWGFTGFYGAPKKHNHLESWNLLRSLNQCFDLPWLCVGDFNEILKAHKKMGGKLRPSKQMQDFQDAVECGFVDLGFVGNKFTWCKQTVDGVTVWERLDRALANDKWISLYPTSNKVIHLEYGPCCCGKK